MLYIFRWWFMQSWTLSLLIATNAFTTPSYSWLTTKLWWRWLINSRRGIIILCVYLDDLSSQPWSLTFILRQNTSRVRLMSLLTACLAFRRPNPTGTSTLAPVILRLLNAALTEGTQHAYKHAVTAFSITHSRMTPVYPLPPQSCIRLLMPLPLLFHLTMAATCSKACFCCPFMLSYV